MYCLVPYVRMEENSRKRKETARFQHMGRGNQTSARQIKMERTRSWPHSQRGDRELSQVICKNMLLIKSNKNIYFQNIPLSKFKCVLKKIELAMILFSFFIFLFKQLFGQNIF